MFRVLSLGFLSNLRRGIPRDHFINKMFSLRVYEASRANNTCTIVMYGLEFGGKDFRVWVCKDPT